MGVKMYSMKNALLAAIFASLFLFSTIAAADRAGSPDSPGNSGQNRPDIPPGLDKQDKKKDKKEDKKKDKN